MFARRILASGVAAVVLGGGAQIALPGIVSASTRHAETFKQAQLNLEQQLTNRTAQLERLATDVSGATDLSSTNAGILSGRITVDEGNIMALSVSVPKDTTWTELNKARASMVRANRVYVVLTPQVFETIEAGTVTSEVTTFQANESTLQTEVNSLVGDAGYHNALNHYVAFVKSVNNADSWSNNVVTAVLAQQPQDYPGDIHVFVNANRRLLDADIALAHATYDASVIGLASGGYTGP